MNHAWPHLANQILAQKEVTTASLSDVAKQISIENISSTLEESLLSIWQQFVGHLPYIVAGVFILIVTLIISKIVTRIATPILKRTKLKPSLQSLAIRFFSVITWTFGLLLTAMVVFPGLTPTKALGGLGIASVAIGFAFKDIFENFFAGILLLWRFPFEEGDMIECEDVRGRVLSVTVRMTEIQRTTGELVVLPNSFLFKNPVYVDTYLPHRRISIIAGVAYGENLDQAVELIEKTVKACSTVLKNRPIQVFPKEFGDSSMNIEVTWWTESQPVDLRRSRGEVVAAIKRDLDEAGIEIPFPYRTLTFKESLNANIKASIQNDDDSQDDDASTQPSTTGGTDE